MCIRDRDGSIVEGESQIPLAKKRIRKVHLYPPDAEPVPSSLEAIRSADAIIFGPGSLYTSILPNLLVDGIAEAVRESKAVKIYICNVMTQPGETDGYTASMHAKAILDHAGAGVIDYILVNSAPIAEEMRGAYASEGAYPVEVDEEAIEALGVRFIKADLINETNVVRHDPVKLSRNIMKMVYGLKTNAESMRLLDYYMIGNKFK